MCLAGATWPKQLGTGCTSLLLFVPLNMCILKELKYGEEVAPEALQGQEVKNSAFAVR